MQARWLQVCLDTGFPLSDCDADELQMLASFLLLLVLLKVQGF